MKEKFIDILRSAFPFMMVLGLWRLSDWFWNPGGVIALIIIFFCTFIQPVSGFSLYGVLFCFLIDYKFNTPCFWTALFCLFYAVNGFQSIIDLTKLDKNGRGAFLLWFSIGTVILVLNNFTFSNLLYGIWCIIFLYLLYFPLTQLIKKVRYDR